MDRPNFLANMRFPMGKVENAIWMRGTSDAIFTTVETHDRWQCAIWSGKESFSQNLQVSSAPQLKGWLH